MPPAHADVPPAQIAIEAAGDHEGSGGGSAAQLLVGGLAIGATVDEMLRTHPGALLVHGGGPVTRYTLPGPHVLGSEAVSAVACMLDGRVVCFELRAAHRSEGVGRTTGQVLVDGLAEAWPSLSLQASDEGYLEAASRGVRFAVDLLDALVTIRADAEHVGDEGGWDA